MVRPENNKKPGKFNFKLLEQLYGNLDNRRLQGDTNPVDDTPDDVKELFDNFVSALETISCKEWDRTAPSDQKVTHLADNDSEEACQLEVEGGYSIRIRKLLATNWDLYN